MSRILTACSALCRTEGEHKAALHNTMSLWPMMSGRICSWSRGEEDECGSQLFRGRTLQDETLRPRVTLASDTSDPIGRHQLESSQCINRLNEIERACQENEATEPSSDVVAFSVLKDNFLARPFLYKCAILCLGKSRAARAEAQAEPGHAAAAHAASLAANGARPSPAHTGGDPQPVTLAETGEFDSVQCIGVKDTWLHGKVEQVAFAFLVRTHPAARRLNSMAPVLATVDVNGDPRIFGYIHEDNAASIIFARKIQRPCLGHHRIFLLSAEPATLLKSRVSGASLRALSVDEANACYSSPLTYGCRDFSLANFREILDHPNHRGTFVLQGREGTLGGSVWDMSGLGSLVLRGQQQHTTGHRDDRSMQRYVLLHNMFFLPLASSPPSEANEGEFELSRLTSLKLARERMLPEFIALVLAHCSSTLGVAYVVVDDDGRDDALVRTLRTQLPLLGETTEYINGILNFEDVAVDCQHWADVPKRLGKSFPANEATGRACSCAQSASKDQPTLSMATLANHRNVSFGGQQQFLDPRDFSTLQSFKQHSHAIPRRQEGAVARL